MLSAGWAFAGAGPWQIATVADVDGDGRADLVWRGPAPYLVVWYMNAATRSWYQYLETAGSQWQLSTSPP
jgi:hypothetical protein